MQQDRTRHADFICDHFAPRFSKAGWYVVGRKDQDPWISFHGPFSKDDAIKASVEFFKDLGRPFSFECTAAYLTATGKVTKLVE